jgi:putative transposase
MARKPRANFPGALYHIMQRGNNHNYIYEDTQDKRQFITIIGNLTHELDFKLLYHVLMDNHFHLVLLLGEDKVSMVMQLINARYTRYYNKRYSRVGTIYGGRFTGVLVTNDQQFFHLLRYIAYNPVRAGMVRYPGEYRWGSHAEILGGLPSIIALENLLGYFNADRSVALSAYIKCIDDPIKDLTNKQQVLVVQDIRNSSEFLHCILDSLQTTESEKTRILNGKGGVVVKPIRELFIHKAAQEGYSIREIATFLSTSYETVRRILKQGDKKIVHNCRLL